MAVADDPAGTLRYNQKPVYTTSNGCPVNGSYFSKPEFCNLSLPTSSLLDSCRGRKALLASRCNADCQNYADPESSQRVGQNGPLLLQDFHLIDLLAHFDRERIPERVVHAKGAGAYGEFEVTNDISDLVSLCEERP